MACRESATGTRRGGGAALALLLLYALCAAGARAGESAQDVAPGQEKVALRWAFGALVGGAAAGRLEVVTRDRALRTGDQFKMMVELERLCFVYLVHFSAEGDLNVLFPYDLKQFDSDYAQGRRYYVPKGDSWFELDSHVGDEVFYLLASPDRLKDLERLLTQYVTAGQASKSDLKKQVLDHLRALRKQQRELAAPAERPPTIGGTVRGQAKPSAGRYPDVAAIADEIRSGGLVVRTFTIEHK